MAQADFTNAVLTPYNNPTYFSPLVNPYESLNTNFLANPSTTSSIGTGSVNRLNTSQNERYDVFSGTFTASGNEFYIASANNVAYIFWKVSNVTFNSGDTFNFQIHVDMTLN